MLVGTHNIIYGNLHMLRFNENIPHNIGFEKSQCSIIQDLLHYPISKLYYPRIILFQVLEAVQKELIQYGDSKISVMEMSHRSSHYTKINEDCQNLVRELM